MQLVTATRKKVKMKMLISSPTGFGKTYSALLLAHGITGDWTKIAVIDTENRSASLYAHLGPFLTIEMEPPYTVADFEKACKMCYEAGVQVIIADSVTHYWDEVKAYVDRLGSGFQNWMKGTPMWNKLLAAVLQTDCHFICTARKKQAYEMSKDEKGKNKVEKKGMENQVRDGFDYEMTIAFELINDTHLAKAGKDRTGMFMDTEEFVITEKTGQKIKEWCESGAEPAAQPVFIPATAVEKPAIGSEAFTKGVERIKKGEVELIKKISETYSLSDAQSKTLLQLSPVNEQAVVDHSVQSEFVDPMA